MNAPDKAANTAANTAANAAARIDPWRISLHGGHSGQYCDHAVGTLSEVLNAACAKRFAVFGVTEHAPRTEPFLYDEERDMGWDAAHLDQLFQQYTAELDTFVANHKGPTHILRGFEAEVVPTKSYVRWMNELRRGPVDFLVGSVHFIADTSIDGPMHLFERALSRLGGLEALAVAYYRTLAEMAEQLRPEVVGHFDLIRKNGRHHGDVDTPAVRSAAVEALEVVRDVGAILDLNCAGFRKGLDHPYPAPWLVREAKARGIPFVFGDDSHGPDDVGRDLDRGRDYLLAHDVRTITGLRSVDRSTRVVEKFEVAL